MATSEAGTEPEDDADKAKASEKDDVEVDLSPTGGDPYPEGMLLEVFYDLKGITVIPMFIGEARVVSEVDALTNCVRFRGQDLDPRKWVVVSFETYDDRFTHDLKVLYHGRTQEPPPASYLRAEAEKSPVLWSMDFVQTPDSDRFIKQEPSASSSGLNVSG